MAGNWSALGNQPSFNADTMLLLTDGTVMCHELGSNKWHKLTPDSTGNYSNGTWSTLAPLLNDPLVSTANGGPTVAPLYFASAVLADGTVFFAGGEYNSGVAGADILSTQIYDPVSNSWEIVGPPAGWANIGDAPSCVLPDGRLLLGNPFATSTAIYDPVIKLWTAAGSKNDNSSEETFTLLPDNTILAVQCTNIPNVEKYLIATDQWVSAGSTQNTLPQACPGFVAEIGPALLLPNGSVFAIGATGNTGVYTPQANPANAGTWTLGPTLADASGNTLFPMDAAAVLLPNGRVLIAASPAPACSYPGPTTFLEYNPSTNTAAVVPNPPANATRPCYFGRMLLLPTGQVLFSNNTSTVSIYAPGGTPNAAWKPSITNCPSAMILGHTYTLTGTQFNGLSQAASYGDDAQMATNYPIVQLTNTASGAVAYLRTFNHSSMGVATGTTPQTTQVQVPMTTPTGQYRLVVIANGIPSAPVTVDIASRDCFFIVDRSTFGQGEIQALINLNGAPAVIDPVLFVVVEGFSASELGLTSANLNNPASRPSIPDPVPGVSFDFSGAVIPADPALPAGPQRFTFPFRITFQDVGMFNFTPDIEPVTLTATFTANGTTVTSQAIIELIKNPNPFILHGDVQAGYAWYLSVDVRVFQMKANQTKFAVHVPTTGIARDVATTFITQVIHNLNGSPGSAGGEFDLLPQAEQLSSLALSPVDVNNVPVYNFALARVRYRDVIPAADVRVFFRMWPAQQTNASYDTTSAYRSAPNTVGQRIALLGVQGDEIITIPFFAAARIDTSSVSMTTQPDPANVRPITPDALGGEVDSYFGCWLDINQPSEQLFPSRMVGGVPANIPDGPFVNMGTLLSIQQLVRSEHQCLLAEIAFDPDPILAGADPSTSDKLAQRNLTFVNVPNPGVLESRRAPQTFEIRPTPSRLPQGLRPDELMIEWGNTPLGSQAQVYLPGVGADQVLHLAEQLYTSHRLTQVDPLTLQCAAEGVTYLPIPKGAGANFAGLLTVDLPDTVKKGEVYRIRVKQITTSLGRGVVVRKLKQQGSRRKNAPVESNASTDGQNLINWRRVVGVFELAISVSTKQALLAPEERRLSVLRWIEKSIPDQSRWYRPFGRYVTQTAERVRFMGGNPSLVMASATGDWRKVVGGGHGQGHGKGHGPGRGGEQGHEHERGREGEERLAFSGKVAGLVYDRFGDFEGFLLDTEDGERSFASREGPMERVVQQAWAERIFITVFVERDEPREPMAIVLRGAPSQE